MSILDKDIEYYITEDDKLVFERNVFTELVYRIHHLEKENERLKEQVNENKVIVEYAIKPSFTTRKLQDYKSRIDKAIEYIQNKNNITKHGIYPNYTYEVDTKDLLNILQNGSDDNE